MNQTTKSTNKKILRSLLVTVISIVATIFLLDAFILLVLYQTGAEININLSLGGAGHVIGVAVVSGLGSLVLERLVMRPKKEPSIQGMLVRQLIHYLLVFGIVKLYWLLAMGIYARNLLQLWLLLGGFTAVYVVAYGIEYLANRHTTKQLNKRIRERREQIKS